VSTYSFLRWLRAGAAGAISETQQAGRSGPRPTFDVTVDLQASRPYSATKALHLYGPGDVVGIDPRQVIRRVPEPGTGTASTQFFAHVELDAPDLPWRFTPFAEASGPDAPGFGLKTAGSLTPWLCLVVVERRAGVELTYTRGDLLPVLAVDDPSRELPDPAAAHAWAHVQLAGTPADRTEAGLSAWIDGNPRRTLARLVCPRLLAPETAYIACVVPVFALGAKAGLGERLTGDPAMDPTASAYAWTATATTSVRLPVYDSWEFVTGAAGGFEDLVRRLERKGDLGTVGTRTLDVSAPGWSLAADPARPVATLLGALRPTKGVAPWPGDPPLVTALADAIDEVQEVAPPIYGRWHAARRTVPRGGASPVWLGELNLDPGLRVAAALGTQVIQANQETYMAAAWAQVGDILRANQLLRYAQAAVAASQRLHRHHLAALDPFATLAVAGPALSRLRTAPAATTTVYGRLAATCLQPVAFGGPARRILRTRGPLGRRIARLRDNRAFDPAEPLALLAGGGHPTTPPALSPLPAADAAVLGAALWAAGLGPAGAALAGMLAALEARGAPTPCPPAGDVSALAAAVGRGLDPAVTVPRRARAQLSLPAGTWDPPHRIDPIMVAPEITTPLFEALRVLDPDWVLPGLDAMPANSVGAVAVNQRFVEAFLVGANHEMGRELLWRGFPTDQRGSVFRVFWDHRGSATPQGRDITVIDQWKGAERLGTHDPERPPGATIDRLVLLLRGDLLARFPGTSIFCVRAQWDVRDDGSPYRRPLPITTRNVALPVFGGRFDPDVAFSGFDFDIDQARGDPPPARGGSRARAGWFVVFQEQPTEPRFGIAGEVGVAAGDPLRSWRDLGTPLVHTAGGRTAGNPPRPVGYLDLPATTADQAFQAAVAALTPAWDGRADSLAAILLASPFRLYLHATDLVGEPEPVP
jgi:hypothetical protein